MKPNNLSLGDLCFLRDTEYEGYLFLGESGKYNAHRN